MWCLNRVVPVASASKTTRPKQSALKNKIRPRNHYLREHRVVGKERGFGFEEEEEDPSRVSISRCCYEVSTTSLRGGEEQSRGRGGGVC